MPSPEAPPGGRELAALARLAAHRAGEALRAAPRELGRKSSPTDPVTAADRAGTALIAALLHERRPADGLLAEDGDPRPPDSGLRWVVDALDGTVNHLYGLPHYAVSVAVEDRTGAGWSALAGVVHDPLRGETFTAVRGHGAWLGERPLRVNDPVPAARALVATEFAYTPAARARQARLLARLLPRVRDIRSTGSSALDLAWTAAGRLDAFVEDELHRWDWAAGALIAAEAGARTTRYRDGVLAAGPGLHPALTRLVHEAAGPEEGNP